MRIEILGTGCAKCKKLHELVEKVVTDTGTEAQITKVEKIEDIVRYAVALTPALVIDGAVKAAGDIPKAAQIEAWLEEAGRKA